MGDVPVAGKERLVVENACHRTAELDQLLSGHLVGEGQQRRNPSRHVPPGRYAGAAAVDHARKVDGEGLLWKLDGITRRDRKAKEIDLCSVKAKASATDGEPVFLRSDGKLLSCASKHVLGKNEAQGFNTTNVPWLSENFLGICSNVVVASRGTESVQLDTKDVDGDIALWIGYAGGYGPVRVRRIFSQHHSQQRTALTSNHGFPRSRRRFC
eukprot:scaffold7033_cov257-Pinguiococcus_pyrenoidosus.AAC.35